MHPNNFLHVHLPSKTCPYRTPPSLRPTLCCRGLQDAFTPRRAGPEVAVPPRLLPTVVGPSLAAGYVRDVSQYRSRRVIGRPRRDDRELTTRSPHVPPPGMSNGAGAGGIGIRQVLTRLPVERFFGGGKAGEADLPPEKRIEEVLVILPRTGFPRGTRVLSNEDR